MHTPFKNILYTTTCSNGFTNLIVIIITSCCIHKFSYYIPCMHAMFICKFHFMKLMHTKEDQMNLKKTNRILFVAVGRQLFTLWLSQVHLRRIKHPLLWIKWCYWFSRSFINLSIEMKMVKRNTMLLDVNDVSSCSSLMKSKLQAVTKLLRVT